MTQPGIETATFRLCLLTNNYKTVYTCAWCGVCCSVFICICTFYKKT